MTKNIFSKIKLNWKSGITVALVSIPLSVSLAVASQSSPVEGIITAIWAGLVASLFGGSNYNIVGPTGALSGLLAAYALMHGSQSLAMLAIMCGVFILLAYLFKLERYLFFIPASTVHGFTLGVAFIIAFNQFNFAFGISGLKAHEKFFDNLIESFLHLGSASGITTLVFLIFLGLLFLLLKLVPKIPGAIILSFPGILLGYLSVNNYLPFKLLTLGQRFPDMNARLFTRPTLYFNSALVLTALTVALIAILETMISARIADNMTKTKYKKRKELFGLGLANIASGLMGGIPATAALARTSLNIKTGATDKISATISSVVVGIISLLLLKYFKFIPLAVIAAILVYVAIRMIEGEHFVRMYKLDKRSFVISMVVAAITIYEDPIIGILVGVVIALLIFMDKISRGQFELIVNDKEKKILERVTGERVSDVENKVADVLVYSIKGQLAYINAQSHVERFEHALQGYNTVILRLRELYFLDLDGVEAFDEIVGAIQAQGKEVYVTGVNHLIADLLQESKFFNKLVDSKKVFTRTTQALVSLGYSV
jgi:SulP family sulfate permease